MRHHYPFFIKFVVNIIMVINKTIQKLFDFYLYSSIHIAIAATLFIYQTYILLALDVNFIYLTFIFSSTLFLYLLHNLLGLNTLLKDCVRDKINKIRKMKVLLIVLISIFGLISTFSFFLLDFKIIYSIIIFAFISLWYVVPLFGNGKRLSDFPVVKIFLISLVWASISSFIPLMITDVQLFTKLLIFLEKFLFIFAIAIPFDIRDMKFDKLKGVATIPILFGREKSIMLSIVTMSIAIVIVLVLTKMGIYHERHGFALLIGYITTIIIILFSKNKSSDYYFTGLLDSTPIMNFLLVLLV